MTKALKQAVADIEGLIASWGSLNVHMTKALKQAVADIEGLIASWGSLNDNDYIEALEEMEDRALTAKQARIEEMEAEAESDEEIEA